jgi:hypothetical protein
VPIGRGRILEDAQVLYLPGDVMHVASPIALFHAHKDQESAADPGGEAWSRRVGDNNGG